MELTRFSVGMRFAMTPAANMTPEQAFQLLFHRVSPGVAEGMTVFGAWDTGNNRGPEPAYVCAFANMGLKRGKALYEELSSDPYLCSYLTAYHPFVQNNAMERYGQMAYLGQVAPDGTVIGGESSYGDMRFSGPPLQKHLPHRKHILIAAEGLGEALPASDVARLLARAAASAFPGVQVLPLRVASGGPGTVDVLIAADSGRYLTLKATDAPCGVLPDRTAVLETACLEGPALLVALSELACKGYERVLLAPGEGPLPKELPPKIALTVLGSCPQGDADEHSGQARYCSGIQTVLERSGFFRLLADASLVVTASAVADERCRLLGHAADTVLFHCRRSKVPAALLTKCEDGTYLGRLMDSTAAALPFSDPLQAADALMAVVKSSG